MLAWLPLAVSLFAPPAPEALPMAERYDDVLARTHSFLDAASGKYGVEIVWKAPLTSYRSEGTTVTVERAEDAAFVAFVPSLQTELDRYPAGLFKGRIDRIVLGKNILESGGGRRSGLAVHGIRTLFVDVTMDIGRSNHLRKLVHHEIWHLLDPAWNDGAWSEVNPPDFHYGKGGGAMQDERAHTLPAFPGFLDNYSTASQAEDRAQFFAALLFAPDLVRERGVADPRIAKKAALLREAAASIGIGAGFWP
jgi:hypothetical protein